MTLEEYNRTIFNRTIRKIKIKDCCEKCSSSEDLEIHHKTQTFAELLRNTLKDLGLEYKNNIDNYSKQEVENIKNILLGKQLVLEYSTLCRECHIGVHKKLVKQKKENTKREKAIVLEKYLSDCVKNKTRFMKRIDREELIETLNVRNSKWKLIKGIEVLSLKPVE